MALKFEKREKKGYPTLHSAFLTCFRESLRGMPIKSNDAVRAIKETDGWRIDKTTAVGGAWLPWEPVNRETYRTLREAKAALRRYARSCQRKPRK